MKIGQIFLQKFVILNVITDSFLAEKWGTLERARRYIYKNLLNLDCHDSIRFGVYQVAFKSIIIWGEFSFPFSAKCFDRNFKCLF